MIVAPIDELTLYPVEDRGKPNLERIPIFVNNTLNAGCYGIMVGHTASDETVNPYQDNLFWFGDGVLNAGDWIFLYTGKGEPKSNDLPQSPNVKLYSVHWGRGQTMFANSNIVPVLFRVDAVEVGKSPNDVPQLNNINT